MKDQRDEGQNSSNPKMNEPHLARFLYGSFSAMERKLNSEACAWARHYQKNHVFPQPGTERVLPNSVIFTNDASDLRRYSKQWRVYFTRLLGSAICRDLDWQDYAHVIADFEAHTQRYAWGALDAALSHQFPNSIQAAARRLKSLLRFWSELSTLRYIDLDAEVPISLADLVESHYQQFLARYLNKTTGDFRADLSVALENVPRSSFEEIRESVIESLYRLSETDTRIKNAHAFRDRALLKEMIHSLEPREYENLTGLHLPALNRTLYRFDDSISERS